MKLQIVVVDLQLPPAVKKWGIRIAVPVALLVAGGAVARAAGDAGVTSLITWSDGQTLKAADLNANFAALETQISGDGTRLKRIYTAGADGMKTYSVTSWFDTQLQSYCITTLGIDGALYCMPAALNGEATGAIYFSDSLCTQSFAAVSKSVTAAPTYALDQVSGSTAASQFTDVYTIVASITGPVGTADGGGPYVYTNYNGTCIAEAVGASSFLFYSVAAVPLSQMVKVSTGHD